MNDSKKHIILIGNPGTGKSTILNGLTGKVEFKAGWGIGQNSKVHWKEHGGIRYGDTPGLSDVEMRKKAAEEITKLLKQKGSYKLIFVVTVEAGRVRPDDVTTINLVLDSIKHPVQYGVILNKVTQRFVNEFTNNEHFYDHLIQIVSMTKSKTDKLFYFKKSEDLEDMDNAIPKLPQDLCDFIHKKVPYNVILADNVKDNQLDEFERIKEMFESQIKEIKENAQKREQMFLETIDKLEKQLKEHEHRLQKLEKK